MDSLSRTLRFALRSLKRSPAFALSVFVTMAIAIGATTTIMGLMNATIVRPLPFRDADRLVFALGLAIREQDTRGVSYLEAMDWAARSRAFDALAAYDEISLNIRGADGDPLRANAEIVSAGFFRVLGADAARGRTFLPEEDRVPDARPVAVISDALWRSRFGGAESVVGRQVTVNGRPVTVVGVMPPEFRGLSFDSDVWIPMMSVSAIRPVSTLENRSSRWLGVVARVSRGRSIDDAQRDLDRVAMELAEEYPATNTDRGARLRPLRDFYLGTTRTLVFALFGAVGFLLLIACANVMSLQLVRATSRRREMALRVALGAGHRALARQLVVEGIVLAAAGAAGGVLLALWGMDTLLAFAPAGLLPSYANPSVDGWVLGYTTLLTAAAGVAFGLVPLLSRSDDLVTTLKEGAPSVPSGLGSLRRVRAQQLLVIAEVAMALVLLSGATLMTQSLRRQLDVDPGFRPDSVLAARLALPLDRYPASGRVRFAEQLVEQVKTLPGVTAAAVGADLPLRGNTSGGHLFYDGGPDHGVTYARHRVSPEYFETLGIRLRRGRVFSNTDGPDAPRVAVVSRQTARRLWPDRDAVGQRISFAGTSGQGPWTEVVGVVDDVRFRDLTGDLGAPLAWVDVYFPFAQQTDETLEIAVRGGRDAASLAAGIQRAVLALDPTLPVFEVAALADALLVQTSAARFGSLMLSLFAGIAIVLAAVGIYGLLAFMVGASRRDIAVRMALGAASSTVVGLVVRKGMTLAALGGLLGLLIAVPSARVLGNLLFDVRPGDPGTLTGVTALLLAVAFMACWLPARRAGRIAPHTALKSE